MKHIVLIIGGGIAAYKCLDLIRRLRERGFGVRAVMTEAAAQFVTPLSVGALTNERVFTSLFDLDDEREIGHIRLARNADLIVVVPATADLIAKMASGHANDLATCVLLATDKPMVVAPAMNPHMWRHPATQRNVAQIRADGAFIVEPEVGEMAEQGEAGQGRLAETSVLIEAIERTLAGRSAPAGTLAGKHVLVTAGPTHEPIDPVRYIANRSSGKQGYAIAATAARAGARVTLISGPVSLPPPAGCTVRRVETATQMLAAVQRALPADVAVMTAAVADWRVAQIADEKIKKAAGKTPAPLTLTENPDILKAVAVMLSGRPKLVVGFAAETSQTIENAQAKLKTKGADWIVANDVSANSGVGKAGQGVMGGERNLVHLVRTSGVETWPEMSKEAVAERLIAEIAASLTAEETSF